MNWKQKYNKKKISLQTQLYVAYLGMFLIALTAFAVFFYAFFSNKTIKESNDNLLKNLARVEAGTEASVDDMNTISININYSSILKTKTAENFNLADSGNLYKDLSDLFILMNGTTVRSNYIYLYDWHNNQLQVASNKRLTKVNLKDQPWYLEALDRGGDAYITTPYAKKVGGYTSDIISLYRTFVNARRQTVGIIETDKQCKDIFRSIMLQETDDIDPVHFYVFNERGQLIYPYQSTDDVPPYPKLTKQLNRGEDSVYKIKNPQTHKEEYLSYKHSKQTGWTYYAVQDKAVALSSIHTLSQTLLLFFGALLVAAVIISRILSSRLVRPLKHLKHLIQGMHLKTLGEAAPASADIGGLNSETQELYDSYEEMNVKLKTSRDQLIKAQEAEIEARSLALQSQMSPHFYYNSLSSIMILAENGDTETVTRMCQNLSGIMRYVTDFKTKIVTVEMELNYIREYLSAMKIRNQSSLSYDISVPRTMMDIELPKLCIHPLVENAYKYGTNCNPPWHIAIHGRRNADYWEITVTDNGPGFTPEALTKIRQKMAYLEAHCHELPKLEINGLGLANVYMRLMLHTDKKIIFRFENTAAGHAQVTIGCCFKERSTWNTQS